MQRKAPLYLLFLLLVPALLYGIYQVSSLSEDEENIHLIYQNQLDAILFSVNQYSDDVVADWIRSFETSMKNSAPETILLPVLQVNPGIRLMFTADSLSYRPAEVFPDSLLNDVVLPAAADTLAARSSLLMNLLEYSRAGYRKIESAQLLTADGQRWLLIYFVLSEPSPQGHRLGAIVVDPESFISMSLGPRLQMVAQGKFVISAFRSGQETPVYSTVDSLAVEPADAMAITKDFWLLPDYYLGIGSTGESLFTIIRNRTVLNVGLLVLMLLVLAAGLYLIFRNIRKELLLAQNKAEFVSNVSHELRTPLALISMFAETLEMGRVRTEEKKMEYYQIIHKETTRLSGIVNKILTFSQMDANKKEFHPEDFYLNEVVADTLDTYSFHLEQKGFTSTYQSGAEPLPVRADREALQEVLINLLDNAIKYSDGQKKIEVTSGRRGSQAFVTVRDYGIGISREDQKQIFDKFFRVSTGDLAKSKGTGLGLSLVKHIIEHHGGKVQVDSSPGKGSAFTILLPLKYTENG